MTDWDGLCLKGPNSQEHMSVKLPAAQRPKAPPNPGSAASREHTESSEDSGRIVPQNERRRRKKGRKGRWWGNRQRRSQTIIPPSTAVVNKVYTATKSINQHSHVRMSPCHVTHMAHVRDNVTGNGRPCAWRKNLGAASYFALSSRTKSVY